MRIYQADRLKTAGKTLHNRHLPATGRISNLLLVFFIRLQT